MEKIPITSDGKLKVEEELKTLKTTERPRIINAIAEARAHGDLSENAEYHSAREKQSFIEGRIKELEAIIFPWPAAKEEEDMCPRPQFCGEGRGRPSQAGPSQTVRPHVRELMTGCLVNCEYTKKKT